MADLRVSQSGAAQPRTSPVPGDGGSGREPQQGRQRPGRQRAGAEELAVALAEADRGDLSASYEQDEDGNGLIHITDSSSGEIVAIVTPDELRAMAEATGLPLGLLVEVAT